MLSSKQPRIVAIIQSRMGSSRLPGKALRPIAGKPMLQHVVERAQRISGVDQVMVATSNEKEDNGIVQLCNALGACVFRGSERDVLDRYYKAAQFSDADVIMRLTGDCPLLDWEVSGETLQAFLDASPAVDYVSNIHPPTYPDGLDTEVFTFEALARTWRDATLRSEREHVTPYIRNHSDAFRQLNVENYADYSGFRWTVDEGQDAQFIDNLLRLSDNPYPLMEETLRLNRGHSEIAVNRHIVRNSGYLAVVGMDSLPSEAYLP